MTPTFLASFPNSRVKPRNATSVEKPISDHTVKIAGAGTGPDGTTVLALVNPNRTFLTIINDSATELIAFGYDSLEVNSGTERIVLEAKRAIDIETKETVYAISLGVGDINVQTLEGEG